MDDAARSAPAEAVAHARRVLETEAAGLTTLAARLPEDFAATVEMMTIALAKGYSSLWVTFTRTTIPSGVNASNRCLAPPLRTM